MDIIKKYWNSVYIYILLLIPGACISAGVFWTVFKLLGYYPHLSWTKIGLFDFSQFIYLGIAVYFIVQNKKDTSYILNHLNQVKCYVTISMFIQYIFILTLFPSDYVWECTFIFFAASVFFFDSKLMLIHSICYIVSLVAAHFINPTAFLPLNEPNCNEIIAFRLVVLFITILLVLVIVYFAEHFLIQAQENKEENLHLLKKQLEYYKNTELMDKELRKFRHDIRNHFICMGHLLANGNMEELNHYFHDLESTFSSSEQIYFSGNPIIDAILNYDLNHSCSLQVKISVYGSLPQIRTVSSMDLCTLFSNILSNAIHSSNQCNESENPELSIHFQSGTRYFSIKISNSISESEITAFFDNRKRETDKNHGFGLNKVKEVTEKYNGTFEQHISDRTVNTEVYLPL